MTLTIDLAALSAYSRKALGCVGPPCRLEITPLTGGYVASGVYRLDLSFAAGDGPLQHLAVVQKQAAESEVRVMHALAALPGAQALPRLIADGRSPLPGGQAEGWFITPFYAGTPLTFADDIPPVVVSTLAQVHAHFASRGPELLQQGLVPVDAAFFARTLRNAQESLAAAPEGQPTATSLALQRDLAAAGAAPVFAAALACLPPTLVHGDVHPGNILRAADGSAVLIDWGNARLAPAMLDLANIVGLGSALWQEYLAAWAAASGAALDPRLALLGYHWATAMVNLQYLPFAAGHVPEQTPGMVARVLRAREELEALL